MYASNTKILLIFKEKSVLRQVEVLNANSLEKYFTL